MVVEYSSKSYPLWSYISGIKGVMRMVPSLRKFDSSEVAKKRMEMIRFYDAHGEAITKQAFGVDRKVISRWKQKQKYRIYILLQIEKRQKKKEILLKKGRQNQPRPGQQMGSKSS